MGVNDIEKTKIEQEIADLKKVQTKSANADKTLDSALSQMSDEVKEYETKYVEQANRKKEALEKKKFSSAYDPKLKEALEIVQKPLQSYGENCEKVVAKLTRVIEREIENGASESKVSKCVASALNVLSDVENSNISFPQISKILRYQPTYEGRCTKRSLEKIQKDISNGGCTIEAQIKKKIEKLNRIEKADKYGVTLDKLDTHESYLSAVKNYENATSGIQLRASAKELNSLGTYLNSRFLFAECWKKVNEIEEIEKAEKAVSDARKALSDSEKTLDVIKGEIVCTESELKKSENEFKMISTGVGREKSSAIQEYNNECKDNDKLVKKLQGELSSLEARKSENELILGKTFILAFGKRKSLMTSIEALEKEISEKKNEIDNTKNKKQCYLEEKNKKINIIDEKISNANSNVKKITTKLDDLRQQEHRIQTTVSINKINLEKVNQSYNAIISKKKQAEIEKNEAEEAKRQAEAEVRRKAEEAKRQAEAEVRRKAEEAERQAEAEVRRKAEEIKRQAEVRRKAEEAKRQAEAETRRKAEEAERQAEAEVRRKAEEAERQAEAEVRRKAEETELHAIMEKQKENEILSASTSNIITSKMDAKTLRLNKKLEKWYPEHKAFAMDSIDKELRQDVSNYAKSQGMSAEQFLNSLGFEIISGQAVYELRHPKLSAPGQEPDVIKNKVESIICSLNEYYPDKKITRSIIRDHDSLGSRISGVYRWLGYASAKEFLSAYGFDYSVSQSENAGRPSRDYNALINTLKEKYSDGPVFEGMSELIKDNPELVGSLKTLTNKSKELFGTTLKDYFVQQEILLDASIRRAKESEEKELAAQKVREEKQKILEEEKRKKQEEIEQIEAKKKALEDYKSSITQEFMENCGIEFVDVSFVLVSIWAGEMWSLDIDVDSDERSKVIKIIEEHGGILKSGVSKNTRFLITSETDNRYFSVPHSKALELQQQGVDIKILTPKEFYKATQKYDAYIASSDILERAKHGVSSPVVVDGDKVVGLESSVVNVTIPDGVKIIGEKAFAGKNIESVSMPDSVIQIEANAFSECKWLREITLSANLQSIGDGAFEFCKRLDKVSLPETSPLTTIGKRAFAHCYYLETAEFGASVKNIGDECFEKCVCLENVKFVSRPENIGKDAFKDCISLEDFDGSNENEI